MNDLNAMCALWLQSGYSILRTCNLFGPFNADVSWVPGSTSPDGYSRLGQYSNFIFNIVIVVIYFKARESINKDYCCCCFCLN